MATKPAEQRVDADVLAAYLASLGRDGPVARRLDDAVDKAMSSIVSLSSLTSPLALDYLQRLSRPIPALTPETGALIVGRAYAAHLAVESEPQEYGAVDVPVLGTLPSLRRNGSPPQDLLVRVVKATRRGFEVIRAVSTPVWNGFIHCLAKRVNDLAADPEEVIELDVVDGLARVGWVLRQVDIHYGLEPERASGG